MDLSEGAVSSGAHVAERMMLELGVLLGIAYVAFLAVWVWATRFR
jgi:hypothetical protein